MKEINWSEVSEAAEFARVAPGGYVCKITAVEDVPDKEYLRIEFDIAEGDFKDYYKGLYLAKAFWGGVLIRSYKEAARPFFKGFITSVAESNSGFKFDNDEKKFVGKLVGIVLGEEEYRKNDGTNGTRLRAVTTRSAKAIRDKDFTVPDKKPLADTGANKATSNGFYPIDNSADDSDAPF